MLTSKFAYICITTPKIRKKEDFILSFYAKQPVEGFQCHEKAKGWWRCEKQMLDIPVPLRLPEDAIMAQLEVPKDSEISKFPPIEYYRRDPRV